MTYIKCEKCWLNILFIIPFIPKIIDKRLFLICVLCIFMFIWLLTLLTANSIENELFVIISRLSLYFCPCQIYGDMWAKLQRAVAIWSGFGMTLTGVQTCGDYMFSGHTVVLTMLNFFVTECKFTHNSYVSIQSYQFNFSIQWVEENKFVTSWLTCAKYHEEKCNLLQHSRRRCTVYNIFCIQ